MKNIIKKIFPKHISKQELEYKIIETKVKLEREREFYKKSQIQSNVRLNQVLKSNEQLNKDILNLKSQLKYKNNPPFILEKSDKKTQTFSCSCTVQKNIYSEEQFKAYFKKVFVEDLIKDLFNYVKIKTTSDPYNNITLSCEVVFVVDKERED